MAERKKAAESGESTKASEAAKAAEATKVSEGGDSTKAVEAPVAAPLTAPVDKPTKVDVTEQPAAPNAVGATTSFANDDKVRLLDVDGNTLTVDDLFVYPTAGSPGTLATVSQRVYREYRHPGSRTVMTQLMYPQGALVSIFEAERVKAEYRDRTLSE